MKICCLKAWIYNIYFDTSGVAGPNDLTCSLRHGLSHCQRPNSKHTKILPNGKTQKHIAWLGRLVLTLAITKWSNISIKLFSFLNSKLFSFLQRLYQMTHLILHLSSHLHQRRNKNFTTILRTSPSTLHHNNFKPLLKQV